MQEVGKLIQEIFKNSLKILNLPRSTKLICAIEMIHNI